ncbi:hypothetical protein GCM10010521_12470 [Streptomyces rameus]|uniref:AB hydrolase-1 domain-containing protein n=1 Tax=Streptomyces rameus TaxID=68261 RepID=A0ABP6MVI7_9ACTN
MPAILIHGVPDTHHVWDGVREHLTRSDVEAWDLPGGRSRGRDHARQHSQAVPLLIDGRCGVGTGSRGPGRTLPGVLGAFDPVCPVEFGEKMAASVRPTRFLRLDSSHWTPIQKPVEVAAAVEEHWSSFRG